MTTVPRDWFEALEVDAEDVARVGYSLAEYAVEYEVPDATRGEVGALERQLMSATTLADAATLLVLIDQRIASGLLAQAATLYERAGAPEAWTFGLACNGSWAPPLDLRDTWHVSPPSDAISSLAALFYEQELEFGNRETSWRAASTLRDHPGLGWSGAGVPARMFAQFAAHAREGQIGGIIGVLNQIVERTDEAIRFSQNRDSWRWRRFLADVPLIDPELLALGCVASRVDGAVVEEVRNQALSPARVALLGGMLIAAERPPESSGG